MSRRFRGMGGMLGMVAAAVGVAALACGARAKPPIREFDGAKAFGYLQQQLQFGYRVPGTPPHEQTGDWILAQLKTRADTVWVQDIQHRMASGKTIHLRNFFARFQPRAAERILYLAHWDTRPTADQASDSADRKKPVLGASDGASGVAVLLGVADALKAKPPTVGVDLLFVDGEDYGNFADSNDVLIGSRWFAEHQPPGYPPLFGVLFDMVGDKDLDINVEGNSQASAPEVVDRVWKTANAMGYGDIFIPQVRFTLIDDHVSLQKAGIHAIDVVDFNYRYWHTTEDTLDKVSARSLQVIGDVAMALVREASQ
jgi:glutaminyl-peptide cyclotransferase